VPFTDRRGSAGPRPEGEARAKLYVAATRAGHSVAIIPKRPVTSAALRYWSPPGAGGEAS